jgi:thymidylate kinase
MRSMNVDGSVGGERSRTGQLVLVVGPDGTGKSTLATRLVSDLKGRFSLTRKIHWRPTILPKAGKLLGRPAGDPSAPHADAPHGRILSLVVLLYYWLDFFFGGWLKIWRLRRRGELIVMERGWQDVAVDGRRYRLKVSPRLIHALAHLLPNPDLVLVLEASTDVLLGRKQELPAAELERQSEAWRRMRFPRRSRVAYLDASLGLDEVVRKSSECVMNPSAAGP